MKSGNVARFFHFHPEVPAVGVVLAVFLFAGLGGPRLRSRLALPWTTGANGAVTTAHQLLQRSVARLPGAVRGEDCEAQRRREAIRRYLRRELEQRARQKPEREVIAPRRSRVEFI
ncbi:MAG: hypothetical protein IT161_01770 [Bryobacterales bacterium]|nr:hypothetical protein [Bryobacterales bacterium]